MQTLAKASMLDAANIHRKECVDSLRREKMAETKAKKRLETELERAKEICASTTRATQQVIEGKHTYEKIVEFSLKTENCYSSGVIWVRLTTTFVNRVFIIETCSNQQEHEE